MLETKILPTFCQSLENYQSYIQQELARQQLPQAVPLAIKASFELAKTIASNIIKSGSIDFQDFMQMALYQTGLGYYASGNQKFGSGGDFVTAPEISALFAQSFAQEFMQVFQQTQSNILELGAGSGIFCVDCLQQLEKENQLPQNYYILEVSAELRARQVALIQEKLPHLIDRVTWLETLPRNFEGVIFANEVADAIPVDLMINNGSDKNSSVEKAQVTVTDDGFAFEWQDDTYSLPKVCEHGHKFEHRGQLSGWIKSLVEACQRAVIFIVDYGHSEDELFNSSRAGGTLQQYYRHHKTDNPLHLLGLQDITSSVNFTQAALAADGVKANLLGYSTQSMYLLAAGIEGLAQQMMESEVTSDTMASIKIGQQLKQLLLPEEMGETCKVLAFSKAIDADLDIDLKGFSLDNQLYRL